MKIKRLPLILGVSFILVFSSFISFYPTGAPAGYTGSPGDGKNCTDCHTGAASTVTGWITSNIPAEGYTPGQTYQITATNSITGTGKFGFEVSPQNASGALLGTLAAGTNNQLVGSNKYVTHVSASTTISSWTFNWTAPVAGTGNVTFYGAFARNKPGPVRLSTLVVSEQSVSLPAAAGPITGPSIVCRGNSYNYSVGTIAGATSYVWSVPSGATISSGQGTTGIVVNFGASATSGNISVYGSNSAGNGAPSSLAITVNSAPAATSSISGLLSPCENSVQTYSVNNVAGVTYTWFVPSGYTINSGQGSSSVSVTIGPANGNIEVAPSNDCGTGAGSGISITVNHIPAAPAKPSGPAVVDLGFTTTSNYTTTGTSGTDSYSWELSPASAGTITGTGLSATVQWGTFLGIALVRVKAVNDCGESTWSEVFETEVINTTGIADTKEANRLGIYPNPGSGVFYVTMPVGSIADNSILKLMDQAGNVLKSNAIEATTDGRLMIDMTGKPSGLYFIILQTAERQFTAKLIVR